MTMGLDKFGSWGKDSPSRDTEIRREVLCGYNQKGGKLRYRWSGEK